MAILKDLIVHGSSRFLNKIYASEIQTPLIEAEAGIIKKLKADDVTVVGLLDVQGQMHTNSWTNSNIATIDGSFYITPTLSSSSGTVSFSSATAATFTGTYSAVSSLYIGNNTASTVQWTSGSKILITGQVQVDGEWIPLGTLLGTLNSNNPTTSMPVVSITDNRNNTSNILTSIYSLKSNTSLSYRNLKISLYQRADNSEYYPLGIFMTALGQNGKTFLDIYGGVNELTTSYGGYANPNVRIGNLSGLPAITTAAGNFTPVGWGIYTTNGYFSGTIVSNTGVIGGWKLGANSLYNGTTGLNNTTAGIYLGTDGIRNYKDTNTYVNITEGVITAKGVNLTGAITASSGTIGGWNIGTDTNKSLYYGNQTPGATTTNLVLSPTSATNSNAIGGSGTGLTWFISAGKVFGVTTAGALYATSGKIGGWTLNADGFYITNSTPGYNANTLVISKGTASTKAIGGSDTTSKNWMISAGTGFGVTTAGTLYANDAHINGEITATSGSIGGIDIINGDLDVSSISIGSLNGANNYAQKADVNAINLSPYFSYSPYVVNNYWKIFNVHNGYTFTDMGDGWVRIQYTNTGSSVVRRDFAPKFNREIKEGTDYTWLIEFRNNYSTGTSTGTDFYLVEANNCQFWGGVIKENLEGSGTGSATFPISYVPTGSSEVYRKRFVKTSEATGSTHWTDGSADNLIGLACFTARCAANTTIDYEVRVSVYEGRYLGDYKPYIDSSAGNVANIALNQSVWYAECPTAAGTAVKVATISPVATDFVLTKGVTVNIKFTNTNSATNSSLQLNVNGTGAKNIKYIYNGSYSNIVAGYLKANQMYQFRYDGTYWIVQMMYNTNNYDRSLYSLPLAASEVIAAGKIAVLGLNNKLIILKSTSFYIDCPPLYVGTTYEQTHVTNANTKTNNYTYWGASFNLTNTHSIQSAAANTNVYIVGTLSGDIFTPSTTVLTCAEPTTEDGLYYMLLGRMTSTTNAVLQAEHPVYVFKNGNFQRLEATTATSYITQIDNTGIKITPYDKSGNDYLQLNSDAISMYRNNIETLKIEDSVIRIGKDGEGQKNVYIDSDSIDIRNNENVLASFTGEDIKFYDGQIGGLEVASFGGANGVRIGNEEETHFVINNSAVKALNNNGATIFSIETTDTLIGNTIKIASNGTVPNAGGSITLDTSSLLSGDEFYIEQILLKLRITAPVFDENGIICQNFQVNQTNQEITLLNHTVDGRPGNFSTISNFVSYLFIDSNTFKYGTASSSVYNLSGTFSHYDGQTSYSGQITIVYDGNNTLTFNSLINSSSFGNSSFTLESDNSWYSYSDIMVRNKYSKAPALTFGTRLGDIGSLSTVIGEGLYAPGEKQMTIGKFNEGIDTQTSSYAFVVGNGQDDIDRSNAFTVDWNGNVGIQGKIHNIIISNGVETKLPLFHFEGKTWTISSISGNGGSWYGTNVDRTIDIAGYTPVAIAGYSVWGGNNAGYCVVPRVYIDRETDDGYGNQTPASLQMYIWNQGTQAATNIKFTVEILYIADNFID